MSIARFAVTRRVAVAMMAAAFLILGIFALPRLAVALLPSFTPPVVTVSVNYPNVSPATIETTVTRPVENAVSRVAGIDILQSDSYEGQSVVRAQFHFGTDIDTAAVDVQQQVARIRNQLPNDPSLQEPQIAKADPNALPVVSMFATSKKRTLRDLSDVVDNQLSDEFSGVAGVASVGTSGEAHRSILIEPDSQRLIAYGVTASQIIARITAENVDLPAGIVQIGRSEYQIRTSALYQNAQEVAATVVGVKDGVPTLLSDVARVSDGITEQRMFARLNGQPSVRLSVTAQPDANIVSVANGVYAKHEAADIPRSGRAADPDIRPRCPDTRTARAVGHHQARAD
ncbi:MAG: efflux RND transporter permease subunit [Candidatus Eremiobacteraeota bacterium]|nr:efflux RND transporter permease subunit [Candidatus Eremiobacteraeota bacterium]